MKNFKSLTIGKVVVMGRETFESLPGKEPLKDRVNIVLSKNMNFVNDKLTICRSMDELLNELEKYDSEDVFVIGGGSVYSQLLPYCTETYITKIENTYVADKHFTNLDKEETWKLVSVGDLKNYNDIQFSYLKYVNSSFG
jgi:dihydrofolate reductase